eukprot:144393-Chlamydomonas_euryale.AAC.8
MQCDEVEMQWFEAKCSVTRLKCTVAKGLAMPCLSDIARSLNSMQGPPSLHPLSGHPNTKPAPNISNQSRIRTPT